MGTSAWPPHGATNYIPEDAGVDQSTFKALMEAHNFPVGQANQCYGLVQEFIRRVGLGGARSAPYEAPAETTGDERGGAERKITPVDLTRGAPTTPEGSRPLHIPLTPGATAPEPWPMPPVSTTYPNWPDGGAIPPEVLQRFPQLAEPAESRPE